MEHILGCVPCVLGVREDAQGLQGLVEQNVELALEIAGGGYVMEAGSVTLEGTAAELRSIPRWSRLIWGYRSLRGRRISLSHKGRESSPSLSIH
jgi:hypothetical protein